MKHLNTYRLFESSSSYELGEKLYLLIRNTNLLTTDASDLFNEVISLVKQGANVNWKNPIHGETSIIVAAATQICPIVKYLLDSGADINGNSNGWSALMSAKTPEMVKLLIESGIDVNKKTKHENRTALITFTCYHEYSNPKCAELMIEAGIDLTVKDSYGYDFIDHCSGKLKEWLKTYYAQKLIFERAPEFYSKFLEYKIKIDDNIKEEFPELNKADELNLL